MPAQHFTGIDLPPGAIRRGSILGSIAGALVGWLPGLSNATANALLTSVIGYDSNPREYIVATSAANTVNAFLGLAAFYAIARTRNGVMVALAAAEELPPATVILLAGAIAAVGAYLLTIYFSTMAGWFGGVNVTALNRGVIAFVLLLLSSYSAGRSGVHPPPRNSGRLRSVASEHPPGLLHGRDHGPGDGLLVRACLTLYIGRAPIRTCYNATVRGRR